MEEIKKVDTELSDDEISKYLEKLEKYYEYGCKKENDDYRRLKNEANDIILFFLQVKNHRDNADITSRIISMLNWKIMRFNSFYATYFDQ